MPSTPGNTSSVGDTTQAPTVANFLADYPKFDTTGATDGVQFGADALQYWLNMATLLLNQGRFGNLYYIACELFMAHNLALEARAEQGGSQTIPGIITGAIAATASGDVSVAYNNPVAMELDAGHWNLTLYGIRFIKLVRLVSAGPLQVTGGCWNDPTTANGAWPGPWPWNFPNPTL